MFSDCEYTSRNTSANTECSQIDRKDSLLHLSPFANAKKQQQQHGVIRPDSSVQTKLGF